MIKIKYQLFERRHGDRPREQAPVLHQHRVGRGWGVVPQRGARSPGRSNEEEDPGHRGIRQTPRHRHRHRRRVSSC